MFIIQNPKLSLCWNELKVFPIQNSNFSFSEELKKGTLKEEKKNEKEVEKDGR